MTTIYKYPLQPGHNEIMMPSGAKVLCAQVQHGVLAVWAMVDPGQPMRMVMLSVYGTGHSMPADPGQYIGTVQMDGGELVWHVFELGRSRV